MSANPAEEQEEVMKWRISAILVTVFTVLFFLVLAEDKASYVGGLVVASFCWGVWSALTFRSLKDRFHATAYSVLYDSSDG